VSSQEVAQRIGQVFLQRSAVNLLSSVLDTPEFFWSAPDHLQVCDCAMRHSVMLLWWCSLQCCNNRCNSCAASAGVLLASTRPPAGASACVSAVVLWCCCVGVAVLCCLLSSALDPQSSKLQSLERTKPPAGVCSCKLVAAPHYCWCPYMFLYFSMWQVAALHAWH
jgi:hypothetical protein